MMSDNIFSGPWAVEYLEGQSDKIVKTHITANYKAYSEERVTKILNEVHPEWDIQKIYKDKRSLCNNRHCNWPYWVLATHDTHWVCVSRALGARLRLSADAAKLQVAWSHCSYFAGVIKLALQ